jgi:hypothetical protein
VEYKLKVICFEIRVVLFQLVQSVKYFVNSYNRYYCAYHVKYSPDYGAKIADWGKNFVVPFLKLRIGISRECNHHNATAGDHEYSIT